MKCPKCQAENPDGAEFCSLCYASFSELRYDSELEEKAQALLEKHPGSKIRCPSCGDLSPLGSRLCLRCGYEFEEYEAYLVSEEEAEELMKEREESRKGELEVVLSSPIRITEESDGGEIMRSIESILEKGYHARLHAHGRNATTYAMKIIALLSEDYRKEKKEMVFTTSLINEDPVTDLEDVQLEIILETR